MRALFEIVMALIGVSILALIIGHSKNTAEVIKAGGSTLNDLLRTVSLQTGMGGAGYGTM